MQHAMQLLGWEKGETLVNSSNKLKWITVHAYTSPQHQTTAFFLHFDK